MNFPFIKKLIELYLLQRLIEKSVGITNDRVDVTQLSPMQVHLNIICFITVVDHGMRQSVFKVI
jgi:hypothetical protein